MKKLYSIIFLFAACTFAVNAQETNMLTGIITNGNGEPVEHAAVVMQTADSVFVNTALTDSSGVFRFVQRPEAKIRLIIQHVSYNPEIIYVEQNIKDAGTTALSEKVQNIAEARVVAERPLLTVDGSTLSYNALSLIKGKPVASAFDALKEVPGIIGSDNSIQLLGANRMRIIINGAVTTMPAEQIYSLLKSIPASRVKNIEVMYTAPAKYDFRGSLINIVLENDGSESFTGEISAGYKQSHYASGNINASALHAGKKLAIDFMLNASTGKDWRKYSTFSRHALSGNTVEIDQHSRITSQSHTMNLRLGADYNFKNENSLSFSYYASGDKSNTGAFADSRYEELAAYGISSLNRTDSKNWLHNVHLQYNTKKLFQQELILQTTELLPKTTLQAIQPLSMIRTFSIIRHKIFINGKYLQTKNRQLRKNGLWNLAQAEGLTVLTLIANICIRKAVIMLKIFQNVQTTVRKNIQEECLSSQRIR